MDGTTATIQGDSESLTDGLSTARWNFSDNPPHGSTPIQNEIYLEGENSNLNGVFDMPFASDRAEQMYRNTEWANGRLNLESGVVKEVAYYTVKLDKYDPEHYLKEIIKRNT